MNGRNGKERAAGIGASEVGRETDTAVDDVGRRAAGEGPHEVRAGPSSERPITPHERRRRRSPRLRKVWPWVPSE